MSPSTASLNEAQHHAGAEVLDVQARGEYLYAAMGKGGFRVFDIANIDNKDISERMVTAPVSPSGPAILRDHEVRDGRRDADDARRRPVAHRIAKRTKNSPSI